MTGDVKQLQCYLRRMEQRKEKARVIRSKARINHKKKRKHNLGKAAAARIYARREVDDLKALVDDIEFKRWWGYNGS